MNMLLGEKLKKARKNIGMSQNEVAEELMLSRQTISKWENNVCLPDLENFQRICKLYKVDFNTILSKDEGKIICGVPDKPCCIGVLCRAYKGGNPYQSSFTADTGTYRVCADKVVCKRVQEVKGILLN